MIHYRRKKDFIFWIIHIGGFAIDKTDTRSLFSSVFIDAAASSYTAP